MERFNLNTWLEDKSRKIVTRNGKPVRIVCWDKLGDYPIIGCIKYSDDYEDFETYNIDGSKYSFNREDQNDLFFEDEEKANKILDELKSYLENTPKEQVEKDWKEIQDWYSQHFTNEKCNKEEELTDFEKAVEKTIPYKIPIDMLKSTSQQLLEVARKELEKENPEFTPKFTYNEKDYSKLANKLIEFRNNTPLCSVSYRDGEGRKVILHYEKEIFDLVRNEIEMQPQPNQEWSEEDEYLYNWCVSALTTRYNDGLFTTSEYKQTKLWLQSLKDRVQPKQEWSKEDKEKQDAIIGILDFQANKAPDRCCATDGYLLDELIDWLKSISPKKNCEPVEDCNEISDKIDYSAEVIGFLKNYIKAHGCTAMNSWVKWLEKKCNILKQ